MIRHQRRFRVLRWPRLLFSLAVIGGVWLAVSRVMPWMAEQDRVQIQLQQAADAAAAEAAQIAYRRDFERAFAEDDLRRQLAFCRERVMAALPYWRPLLAVAIAPGSIDAYVALSQRVDSLHRISCRADGLHEARVAHPLAEALLAARVESAPAPAGATPDLWQAADAVVERSQPEGEPRRLELLLLDDPRSIVVRRRIERPVGELRDIAPTDAPDFASLVAGDAPPEGLAVRQRMRWSSATGAAFELLAAVLPADAAIAGARFDDDGLSVVLRGPRADLDAPFGTIDFDAWGEPTTWLYPYASAPGFACATGITLDALRQRFDATCGSLPGCSAHAHFSIADYGCAAGREGGGWLLHVQPD